MLRAASSATAVPNIRNFSGAVESSSDTIDRYQDLVKGDAFAPERSYFSVRLVEMRLAEAGRYFVDFFPMCSCFLRFTYGSAQRNVPFILGSSTIESGLGKEAPKSAAKHVSFKDLYIVRNVPVKADNLVCYCALCRFTDGGLALGLLNLLSDVTGMVVGPVPGAAVKTGVDLTGRLANLLGVSGVQTRFGLLNGNALTRSGYWMIAGVPAKALDSGDLKMIDGQVYRTGAGGPKQLIDEVDYLVLAFEHRTTIVDDNFASVSVLPFHTRYDESRAKLLEKDTTAAESAFTKLLIEVATSPDVTEADRLGLISAYRRGFDEWKTIVAGTRAESAKKASLGLHKAPRGAAPVSLQAKLMTAASRAPPGTQAILSTVGANLSGTGTGSGKPEQNKKDLDAMARQTTQAADRKIAMARKKAASSASAWLATPLW